MQQRVDTKRRRTWRDPNQYRQLASLVSRRGQKTSAVTFMRRLVTSSYDYTKFIMRGYILEDGAGIGTGGAGGGVGRYYRIGQETATANITRYPVYMFNLTTLPQFIAGTYRNQGIGFRMQNDPTATSNANVTWVPVDSMNLAGTTGSNAFFQPINSDVGGVTGQAFPKALMEYITLRYTMRGPRARPTKFTVQIIQPFKWFRALPDNFGAYDHDHNTVWVSMANRLSANMCQNLPQSTRAPWKVWYNKTYEIQPTSTTEGDVGGHDVHQRHYWKCNRVLNYRQEGSNEPLDVGQFGDLNLASYEGGRRLSFTPSFGSQLYLLVTAYSPCSETAFDSLIHPSFDLSIEKKISNLGSNTA